MVPVGGRLSNEVQGNAETGVVPDYCGAAPRAMIGWRLMGAIPFAPSRIFESNLKDGWKKFTKSRAEVYSLFNTAADGPPVSLP